MKLLWLINSYVSNIVIFSDSAKYYVLNLLLRAYLFEKLKKIFI